MKIISLNVNGFYNPEGKYGNNKNQDSYNFEKLFQYLKRENEKNKKEIIFCLQEFRIRKGDDDCKSDIEEIFNEDFKIICCYNVYSKDNKKDFYEFINNKKIYIQLM